MQTQIEPLISQLTGNAMMFTAYDVTMMLRRANPTTNIKHHEVRDAVHNLYQNGSFGGYTRTTTKILSPTQGYGIDTLVYHEQGTDAGDYDPNFFATTTPQSLSVPSVLTTQSTQQAGSVLTPQTWQSRAKTTTPTSSVGNSLPDKPKHARYAISSVPQDKFGRIRVPASVLRAAGFGPKDTVRVVLDPNLIVVTNSNDSYGSSCGRKYVVDTYNNIRVHLRGKWASQKFSMQPGTDKIYITPV